MIGQLGDAVATDSRHRNEASMTDCSRSQGAKLLTVHTESWSENEHVWGVL